MATEANFAKEGAKLGTGRATKGAKPTKSLQKERPQAGGQEAAIRFATKGAGRRDQASPTTEGAKPARSVQEWRAPEGGAHKS